MWLILPDPQKLAAQDPYLTLKLKLCSFESNEKKFWIEEVVKKDEAAFYCN